MRSAKML